MFIQELTPIFQEIVRCPTSFLGGFASGVLRLNLAEDPIKSWLDRQAGTCFTDSTDGQNGKTSGPQQISID
jgi:hypothetical protein